MTLNVFCVVPHAQPLLIEQFDYPAGQKLAGQGSAIDGWSGPWSSSAALDSGLVSLDTILDIELAYRSRLPVGSLKSAPGNYLERGLSTPIDLMQGPYWIAFLSECQIIDGRSQGSVALIDHSFEERRRKRLEFGKTWTSRQIVVDGVDLYPRSTGKLYGRGQWIVACIYPTPAGLKVYTWIDPSIVEVPDTSNANVKCRPLDMTTIDAVRLIALDEPGLTWKVDDLFIGRTYGDVIPDDWVQIDPDVINRNVYEPFDYEVGEGLENQDGGSGFSGSWQLRNSFDHRLAGGSILFGNDSESSPPLMQLIHDRNNTNARYIRRLDYPVLDDGNQYWFAVVMDIDFTVGTNVAQVFLGNIDELGPNGPSGQYVQVGKSFADNRFSLGIPGNFVFVNNRPAEDAYLVILRISTSGDSGPDLVDLWLNPDTDAIMPDENARARSMELNLNNGWNAVGFKVEGDPGIEMRIDDIATGSAYRAVLPDYLTTTNSNITKTNVPKLYPNPGDGTVLFRGGVPNDIYEISVRDDFGRLIYSDARIVESGLDVRVVPNTAPPGAYFIQFSSDRYNYSFTYIKK